MGCSGSASRVGTEPDLAPSRRRLSVGRVEGGGGGDKSTGNTSEDRGLISILREQSIIDLLQAQGDTFGRKMSVSSSTDENRESFKNKTVQELGDKFKPESEGLGYTCRKGLKPESPNQDSWFIVRMEKYSIYAVFDGHGQRGHDVSQFVKEALPKLIVKHGVDKVGATKADMQAMFKEVFSKTQSLISLADKTRQLSARMSGTTATVCIHDMEHNKLWLAHVADSTCVLGKRSGEGVQLTRDHKPELKEERSRIEKLGGRVIFDGYANHRVYAKNSRYPGLNMSRCLGDLMGHEQCGILWEPEIYERDIEPDDQVLLICSDGVWEFISPNEAVNMIAPYSRRKGMQAAEHLAREAWDRWMHEEGGAVVDDITVVLVHLQGQQGQSREEEPEDAEEEPKLEPTTVTIVN